MPLDDLPDLSSYAVKKPKVDGDPSVARVVDDELARLGWSDNARLSALGDVGRENSWNRDVIFKGHTDPENKEYNRGIISWQKDRVKNLDNYLKKNKLYGRNDDEEIRGMVRFMDEEMASSPEWKDIHKKMRDPDISTYDASENLRKYIKYVPGGKFNSYDPKFRVKNNARWATQAQLLGLGQLPDLSEFSGGELPDLTEFSQLPDLTEFATETRVQPTKELDVTIQNQIASANDPNVKTRFGVLATEPEQATLFANQPNFKPFETKEGTLWLNTAKIYANKKLKLKNEKDLQQYLKNPKALTTLLGIAEDVGNETRGTAIRAKDPKTGIELATGVVTNPISAVEQAQNYKDQFPDAEIEVTDTDVVTDERKRMASQVLDDPRQLGGEFAEPVPHEAPHFPIEPKSAPTANQVNEQYVEWLKLSEIPDSNEARTEFNRLMQGTVDTANAENKIAYEMDKKAVADYNAKLPKQSVPTKQTAQNTQKPQETETEAVVSIPETNTVAQKGARVGESIYRNVTVDQGDIQGEPNKYLSRRAVYALARSEGIDRATADQWLAKKGGNIIPANELVSAEEAALAQKGKKLTVNINNSLAKDFLSFAGKDFVPNVQAADPEVDTRVAPDTRTVLQALRGVSPTQADTEKREADPLWWRSQGEDEKSRLTDYRRLQADATIADKEASDIDAQIGAGLRTTGDFVPQGKGIISGVLEDLPNWSNFLGGLWKTTIPGLLENYLSEQVIKSTKADLPQLADRLNQLGKRAERIAHNSDDGSGVYKLNAFAGSTASAFPRYILTTAMAGGNVVVGMAAESGLRSIGKGNDALEVTKDISHGAILGALFHGASKGGAWVGSKIFSKTLDAETKAALANPEFQAAYRRAIANGEKAELTPELRSALWKGWVAKNGTRIGIVGGVGTGEALLEGQDVETALKQGAIFALQDLVLGYLTSKKGRKLSDLDGKVVRVPDENGKPKDVALLTKGENLEAKDVTGKVPETVVDAVVLPESKVAPTASDDLINSTKLTDAEKAEATQVKMDFDPNAEPQVKVEPTEQPVEKAVETVEEKPAKSKFSDKPLKEVKAEGEVKYDGVDDFFAVEEVPTEVVDKPKVEKVESTPVGKKLDAVKELNKQKREALAEIEDEAKSLEAQGQVAEAKKLRDDITAEYNAKILEAKKKPVVEPTITPKQPKLAPKEPKIEISQGTEIRPNDPIYNESGKVGVYQEIEHNGKVLKRVQTVKGTPTISNTIEYKEGNWTKGVPTDTMMQATNASGESAASLEAQSRLKGEQARGEYRVLVDTRSGIETKLPPIDGVDHFKLQPYQQTEWRGGNRDGEIIDRGTATRAYTRKSPQQDTMMMAVGEKQTDTPEFKRFFGKSKVVNEKGLPRRVYHGTKSFEGNEFRSDKIGSNFGYDKQGFFFTNEVGPYPGSANEYAENGEIIPAYVRMENPYTLEDWAKDLGTTVKDITHYAGDPQPLINLFDEDRRSILDFANKHKKDGVLFEHNVDGETIGLYVPFDPQQIKSAIGNNGEFDPNNPDITKRAISELDANQASFQAVRKLPTKDVEAQSNFTKNARIAEGGVIAVDQIPEIELLRRIMGEGTQFYGVLADPNKIAQVKGTLDKMIAHSNSPNLKRLNRLIDTAMKHDGTVIFAMTEETMKHERKHRFLFHNRKSGRNVTEEVEKQIIESDGFKKALKAPWGQNYASFSPSGKVEEYITAVANEEWNTLGVTNEAEQREANGHLIDFAMSFAEINKGDGTARELMTGLATEMAYVETYLKNQGTEGNQKEDTQEVDDSNVKPAEREKDRPDDETSGESKPDELKYVPSGKEKFSKTPETMQEAGFDVPAKPYISATNVGQNVFANQVLEKGLAEAQNWFDSQLTVGADNNGATTAVGLNLMKSYGTKGNLVQMNKVADQLIPYLREAGQAIQAMAIINIFDPSTASTYAAKYVKQKTGKDLTANQKAKAENIAIQMSEAVQAEAVTDAIKKDIENDLKALQKERDDLAKEVHDLTKQYELDMANAKAEIAKLTGKKGRSPKVAKMLGDLKAHSSEINRTLNAAFGTKTTTPMMAVASGMPEDVQKALVDWATIELDKGLNAENPVSIPEFYKHINDRTNNSLSEAEIKRVHAEAAVRLVEPTLTTINRLVLDENTTAEQYQRALTAQIRSKNRQAHLKEARKLIKDSMDEFAKKLAKKPDRFVSAIIHEGVEQGFSDEAIYHALARRSMNPREAEEALKVEYPDVNARRAMVEANRLVEQAKHAVRNAKVQADNAFALNEAQLKAVDAEQKTNASIKRRVEKDAQNFYDSLSKGNLETFVEGAVNYRKANLLTAFKTHMVNIVSNATFAGAEEIFARNLAALADIAASFVTGQRTVQMTSPIGIIKGAAAQGVNAKKFGKGVMEYGMSREGLKKAFKEMIEGDKTLKNANEPTGIEKAWSILRTGDTMEAQHKLQYIESHLREKGSATEGKLAPKLTGGRMQGSVGYYAGSVADAYINLVFRTLQAEDALFKVYAFRRSIEEQAQTRAQTEAGVKVGLTKKPYKERYQELLANPTAAMQVEAAQFADDMTYQNTNPISTAITRAKNVHYLAKAAIEIPLPFDRTPTNIVLRTLEYTPLGFAKAAVDVGIGKAVPHKMKQKFDVKYRHAIQEDLGTEEFFNLDRNEQRRLVDEGLSKAFTRQQQQRFARAFGRGTTGLAVTIPTGFILAAMGLLTGIMSGDDDDRNEKGVFFGRLKQGVENKSLLVPGVGRFVLGDDPWSKSLILGATMYEQAALAKKNKADALTSVWDGTSETLMDAMFEQPLLRETKETFSSKSTVGDVIGGTLRTFVPATGMMGAISDIGDEKDRHTTTYTKSKRKGKSFWDIQSTGFVNAFTGRLPILRNYFAQESDFRDPQLRGNVVRRTIRALDINNMRPPIKSDALVSPEMKRLREILVEK